MNKTPHTAPAPNPGGALEPGDVARTSVAVAPPLSGSGTGAAGTADLLPRPGTSPLRTVCCVCKVVISDGDLPVSHGYCGQCVEVELAKIEASA